MNDGNDPADRPATRDECLSELEGCLSEYSSPWRTTGSLRGYAEEVLAICEKFLCEKYLMKSDKGQS